MKKIILLLLLPLLLGSCNANKKVITNTEKVVQIKYDTVSATVKILESKHFLDDIQKVKFFVNKGKSINPEVFKPYVGRDGSIIKPKIQFDLKNETQLNWEGKGEWKGQTGYILSTLKSGHRLMYTERSSESIKIKVKKIYLRFLEHKGVIYDSKNTDSSLDLLMPFLNTPTFPNSTIFQSSGINPTSVSLYFSFINSIPIPFFQGEHLHFLLRFSYW